LEVAKGDVARHSVATIGGERVMERTFVLRAKIRMLGMTQQGHFYASELWPRVGVTQESRRKP
jgi:hypothetical protein